MIKTIIFDFDDTLYIADFWKEWPGFIKKGFLSVLKSQEKVNQLYEKYSIKGNISQVEISEICEKEGLNYKRFRKYLKTHVNIIEDAKEFISNEFLRDLAKKYNLYILSMSEKIHVKYYSKKFGIDLKPFKKVITANPLDKTKGLEMEKIMKHEKLAPNEVLMVGDSFKSDIEPAKKLEVNTYHFQKDFNQLYEFFTSHDLLNCEKYKK